jgi:hypothetical protein
MYFLNSRTVLKWVKAGRLLGETLPDGRWVVQDVAEPWMAEGLREDVAASAFPFIPMQVVAEVCSVSKNAVTKWRDQGLLLCFQPTPGRWYCSLRDFVEFLEKRQKSHSRKVLRHSRELTRLCSRKVTHRPNSSGPWFLEKGAVISGICRPRRPFALSDLPACGGVRHSQGVLYKPPDASAVQLKHWQLSRISVTHFRISYAFLC